MPRYSTTLRGKWIYDGCTSLDEMRDRLIDQINELSEMIKAGIELGTDEVCDDYAFLYTEDEAVAEKFGFNEEEEFEEDE